MTTLGVSLITMGLTLVCAGLIVWGRAPHTDSIAVDDPDPHEFRVVLDALQDGERRNESSDLLLQTPPSKAASALLNPFTALALAQVNSVAAASVQHDGMLSEPENGPPLPCT